MVMRWRQGVTFSGAIAVCGENSTSISGIVTSYATGTALRVRGRLGAGGGVAAAVARAGPYLAMNALRSFLYSGPYWLSSSSMDGRYHLPRPLRVGTPEEFSRWTMACRGIPSSSCQERIW